MSLQNTLNGVASHAKNSYVDCDGSLKRADIKLIETGETCS